MLPELLSPAGGFDAALAAFQYGADAVYLGLPRFSARADADNLTPERLRTLLAYARSFSPPKKVYVTFNTLVQDAELPQALELLDTLNDLSPDGLIVQDLGLARLVRDHFPRLALHASTQLAVHNLDGVLALQALGFTRVVPARELTLDEVGQLVRDSSTEIEIFVHGALCYSFSGLCLFSSHMAGRSGNRGRCAYCCREAFARDDAQNALYPFSMRDLALAPLLERVVETGVHSLKIEGRMKSPLYVACVTDYYRRKLDGRLSPEAERELVQDLQTVFSRPWTSLYAEGFDAAPEAIIDPVAIGHRGAPIGRAAAVFRDRRGIRWLRFTSARALQKHDGLQVELPGGGKPFGCAVNALRAAGETRTAISLPAGSSVEVALPEDDVPAIPPGAPVFCSASQAVRRRYEIQGLREAALPSGRPADVHVTLSPDSLAVRATAAFDDGQDEVSSEVRLTPSLPPARQPEQTPAAVRKAFERLGDTAWRLGNLTLDDPASCYAPPSLLNEARRAAFDALTAEWEARRQARRLAISAAWGLARPAAQPAGPRAGQAVASWSLKIRAEDQPLPAEVLEGVSTLVLAIGHASAAALAERLAAWTARFPAERILLALPLITRQPERAPLAETVRSLAGGGWTRWECADLGGHHLLAEQALTPVSADWSLYAMNRVAAAELARLGLRSFVLSPECGLDNLRALSLLNAVGGGSPTPELLAYQHTPLFLSETAPCPTPGSGAASFTDRRGRTFLTRKLDGRWITVCRQAFCAADRLREAACARGRIDLSYSPDPADFPAVIRAVCEEQRPPDTHTGNLTRGLL